MSCYPTYPLYLVFTTLLSVNHETKNNINLHFSVWIGDSMVWTLEIEVRLDKM